MTTHEFSFSWVDREIIYGFYLSASFFIVTPFCGLPPNGLYYLRVVRARHHEGIKSQAEIMLADGDNTTRQVHTFVRCDPAKIHQRHECNTFCAWSCLWTGEKNYRIDTRKEIRHFRISISFPLRLFEPE